MLIEHEPQVVLIHKPHTSNERMMLPPNFPVPVGAEIIDRALSRFSDCSEQPLGTYGIGELDWKGRLHPETKLRILQRRGGHIAYMQLPEGQEVWLEQVGSRYAVVSTTNTNGTRELLGVITVQASRRNQR